MKTIKNNDDELEKNNILNPLTTKKGKFRGRKPKKFMKQCFDFAFKDFGIEVYKKYQKNIKDIDLEIELLEKRLNEDIKFFKEVYSK
jgi:hypothetical protein